VFHERDRVAVAVTGKGRGTWGRSHTNKRLAIGIREGASKTSLQKMLSRRKIDGGHGKIVGERRRQGKGENALLKGRLLVGLSWRRRPGEVDRQGAFITKETPFGIFCAAKGKRKSLTEDTTALRKGGGEHVAWEGEKSWHYSRYH